MRKGAAERGDHETVRQVEGVLNSGDQDRDVSLDLHIKPSLSTLSRRGEDIELAIFCYA